MLYLVSTPIGNLSDITDRAKSVLASVDVIACEDTRTTQKLMSLLGIKSKGRFVAFHDHNEQGMCQKIVQILKAGQSVALCSDAGTPLISDPGYKLVALCATENIDVVPVPGANALLPALQLSALPTNQFCFIGFLPPKKNARRKELEKITQLNMTMVFYEAPHRLVETLTDMAEILGQRNASVSREITKKFEESKRGTLSELVQEFLNGVKGECVIVVEGAKEVKPLSHKEKFKARLEEKCREKA